MYGCTNVRTHVEAAGRRSQAEATVYAARATFKNSQAAISVMAILNTFLPPPTNLAKRRPQNFEWPFTSRNRLRLTRNLDQNAFQTIPDISFFDETKNVRQLLSDFSEPLPLRNAPETLGNALE